MRAYRIRARSLALVSVLLLAGCGTADNPYERIAGAPLVKATLLQVTLASESPDVVETIAQAGWNPVTLPPNYQQADMVQASLWGVPEPVAAAARHFHATQPGRPDLQLLVMPLAARGRDAEADLEASFFRNVLGTQVPAWPLPGARSDKIRVQVWTFRVADIVDASKRLRSQGIPVIFDPVGLTTAYLGDHRTLAIRAPDGTVVQLVQTQAS